ncbi:MAG: hypothetical protein QME52_06810 [Bacteroidota bacterium]|nr:hypothetical protein [Bacteroidota bacterium]
MKYFAVTLLSFFISTASLQASNFDDDPVNQVRKSDLIIEGQVVKFSEEKDEYNVVNHVVRIAVDDIIAGKHVKNEVLLKYPTNFYPDIAWIQPKFIEGENVILLLTKSGDYSWFLNGGGYGKFSITGNTIEKSKTSVADFKQQIKDVFHLRSNRIIFPARKGIQDSQQYDERLGGEFSIINPGFYGPLKGTTINFQLNPIGAVDKDGNPIPFATLKDAIQRAIDTWNNVSNSYITFSVSGTQYTGNRTLCNGVSTITFEDLAYNGATYVIRRASCNYTGIIDEVDMVFSKGSQVDRFLDNRFE